MAIMPKMTIANPGPPSPTDPAELEKLKALAEAATPGPFGVAECRLAYPWLTLALDKPEANFIAAANPQITLALIAEIERLRAQVNELKTPRPRHWRGCLCGRCDT